MFISMNDFSYKTVNVWMEVVWEKKKFFEASSEKDTSLLYDWKKNFLPR